MKIPKTIHQIWLGKKPMPKHLMATCWKINKSWDYQLWTEDNLPNDFINQYHIEQMSKLQNNYPEAGQSDIIRYEILYRHGGFFVDADSGFINPLDDFFTENDSFCCFESEDFRGILLANGYLASTQENDLMWILIQELNKKESVIKDLPWIETGPLFFTQAVINYNYERLKVYPSHYFIPKHFSNPKTYCGPDKVYCTQHWGSTTGLY